MAIDTTIDSLSDEELYGMVLLSSSRPVVTVVTVQTVVTVVTVQAEDCSYKVVSNAMFAAMLDMKLGQNWLCEGN